MVKYEFNIQKLVDISSNDLTETEGALLLNALQENLKLVNLDLRLNKVWFDFSLKFYPDFIIGFRLKTIHHV